MSEVAESCYYEAFPGVDVSRVKLEDGARHVSIEAGDDGVSELVSRTTLTETTQLVAALTAALADQLSGLSGEEQQP